MDLARTASAAARDAAAAVGATPIRLHTRAAPIEYDVEGLDTEKLVYRLGTLAAAMALGLEWSGLRVSGVPVALAPLGLLGLLSLGKDFAPSWWVTLWVGALIVAVGGLPEGGALRGFVQLGAVFGCTVLIASALDRGGRLELGQIMTWGFLLLLIARPFLDMSPNRWAVLILFPLSSRAFGVDLTSARDDFRLVELNWRTWSLKKTFFRTS